MAAVETAKQGQASHVGRRPRPLLLRVVSAAVLLGLVAAALWTGLVEVTIVVVAAALLSAWELERLLDRAGARPPAWLLYPLTAWLAMGFALPGIPRGALTPLGAGVVLGLVVATATRTPFTRWAAALGGACYLGLSLGYYVALFRWRPVDASHFGLRLVASVVLCAVVNDTVAYFAGGALGRRPFFPSISPAKTLEGALSGLAGAVVFGAFAAAPLAGVTPGAGAGLGLLVAVAAQGGDLVESSLKRQAGVKDSSGLVPGHGGLLDRVDSLVLVAPVVYCYLRVISA